MNIIKHPFCKVPMDLYEQNLTKNQIKFYILLHQSLDSNAKNTWKGYTVQYHDKTIADKIGSTTLQVGKMRRALKKLALLEYKEDHPKKYKDNKSKTSYRYKLPPLDHFCQIPKDLFKQDLTGTQLKFYLFIAARYDSKKRNGWSIPQQDQQIAEGINSTVGEGAKIRQKLTHIGLIETDRIPLDKDSASYKYRIKRTLPNPTKQTAASSIAPEKPVEDAPLQPSIIMPTKATETTIAKPQPSQTKEEQLNRIREKVRKTLSPEDREEIKKKYGKDLSKPISPTT